MREAGAFWKEEEAFFFSIGDFLRRQKKKTQPRPLPSSKNKKLFLSTAPVTELDLPERIEEVLLPSAVRIPGFEGLKTTLRDEDTKKPKKKKEADNDNGGEGGKAAKRRKLVDGGGTKRSRRRPRAPPAGAAPARSIAWNRYGTLLAGKDVF